jgi:4-amino-4-deoxy-L-arabinose transferase-like glycosyltransferase
MNLNPKLKNIYLIILFSSLVYFPVFLHLEVLPMRVWDEARLAINAYEMSQNGNFIVTHFEGKPDMWNTKPPLMIWLQVGLIKLLGFSELATRLPAALSAFFTALVILLFAIKYIKNYWYGFISVLILITSYGYIHIHTTRTGDYDSPLTLFSLSYCLSWFLFIQFNEKKYLNLFFITLTLAVYTKGIAALIFIPGILLYTIFEKQFKSLFRNKFFFINLFLCVITISAYYLIREYLNPGYLKAVWENELGGRYLTTLEGHGHPFLFYYYQLIDSHYSFWYPLIPCGIAIGLLTKDPLLKKITLFSTLMMFSYLLFISLSRTKISWYDLPLYPFLALISAIPVFWIFSFLKNSVEAQRQFKFNIIPFAFLFLVFFIPYKKIIAKIYLPKEEEKEQSGYNISYFLKEAVNSKRSVNNSFICYDGHKAHLEFYIIQLNSLEQAISFKEWKDLSVGDTIIATQDNVKEYIENNYFFQLIETYDNVKKYVILGKFVHLKAMNNKYISADEGFNLVANRDHAFTWESLIIKFLDEHKCTIQSHKKLFLGVDNQSLIIAKSEAAGRWEIFEIVRLDRNNIALKAENNKYLSIDTASLQIFARSDSISSNETFTLESE